MIEFHYQEEYSDKFGKILRPLALVSVSANKKLIQTAMYVDSGADVTMMPLRAGNDLEFKYDSNKIFSMNGIARSMPCILERAEILIGSKRLSADITWALSDEAPFFIREKRYF